MRTQFEGLYEGRTVLVTGHTGFKGSWLALWLGELGADVVGYSLQEPPTEPSNFDVSDIGRRLTDVRGDVRDLDRLVQVIEAHRPSVVFHLAAQSLVLQGVAEPHPTFETNALGTVNVMEAIRRTDCVRALVSVTTDKVYHNEEWLWGYREADRLGGHDPYSASKSMAELAVSAYRDTYFAPATFDRHGVAVASARAGNVIGGGDFARYRLVPDCVRALVEGTPIGIRNPLSVRPWQFVLEPLSGYLWLGARLLRDGPEFAEAWNFGPLENEGVPARDIADELIALWGSGEWVHEDPGYARIETGHLRLSWEKAAVRLGWRPVYGWKEALAEIVAWHKAHVAGEDMFAVGRRHVLDYANRARDLGLAWASSA
jgi:CDP-glucose 4,6-dehydratase